MCTLHIQTMKNVVFPNCARRLVALHSVQGADVRFVAVSRHVQRALDDVDSCEPLDWTHFDLCDSPYSVASVE